jgi:hypothetical protein
MNDVFAQPVGCRPGRPSKELRRPPLSPVLAYALAAIAGGMLVGTTLALIGDGLARTLPVAAVRGALVFVALLGAAAVWLEMSGRVAPLQQRRAQVPRRWTLWRSKSRTAAAFGFMLGAGVFTYLHHATAYVLALVILVSASPVAGLLIGGVYGLTRGVMLAYAWAVPPSFSASKRIPQWVGTASNLLPLGGIASIITAAIAIVIVG